MDPPAESLANRKMWLNVEKLYNWVVLEDDRLDGIPVLPNFLLLRDELSAAVGPTSNEQDPG